MYTFHMNNIYKPKLTQYKRENIVKDDTRLPAHHPLRITILHVRYSPCDFAITCAYKGLCVLGVGVGLLLLLREEYSVNVFVVHVVKS